MVIDSNNSDVSDIIHEGQTLFNEPELLPYVHTF
jgi:hypothetical protein